MSTRFSVITAALVVAFVGNTGAQEPANCDKENNWWGWRGGPSGHACEVRDVAVRARGVLSVDGGENGSISVAGENRRDVQVRAVIQAWAFDDAEAQRIVGAVTISTDGVVKAEGPQRAGRTGWSVSYHIVAPRDTDLNLETHNGSIGIANVRGDLDAEALNGSISLDSVAGNVHGRTTNGGVDATLTGDTWEGEGLDLRTTNGGVRLRVPEDYSARLETGTVHGGIDVDFPVTLTGRISREFSTTLGKGGPLVHVSTTNGGVRISRNGRSGLTRLQ
jgi:hypothetical protein